jgi:hypothetical protein
MHGIHEERRMKFLLATLIPISIFSTSPALAASAPIVVVMPTDFEARTDPEAKRKGGLLVWMLASSIGKEGNRQIARFYADLADPAFPDRVARSLSCIGADRASADCPAARVLAGNTADALTALDAARGSRVLLVRFHPFKTDERIRLRAIVNDAVVGADGLMVKRYFTAVFNSRAQNPVMAQEIDSGLEELRQMLTLLDREVPADRSAPAGWEQSPGIKAFERAGRLNCSGGGCKKHRVLRDSGSRAWITTTYAQGATLYGWSVVSLDDASARRSGNTMLYVQTADQ